MSEFSFAFIPESDAIPVQTLRASMSGGLENDQLQAYAKAHLKRDSDTSARLDSIQKQMREAGTDVTKLDPQLLSSLHSMGTSLEIVSLQLPSPRNGYIGVSLYSDANAINKDFKPNTRATRIVRACGHANLVVMGDCFLGRYYDNEEEEWLRRDFLGAEAAPDAQWVLSTAADNKGKNLSAYSSSGAMSASMNQMLGSNKGSIMNNPFSAMAEANVPESAPDDVVSWTDQGDEVEVKIKIDANVTSKQVKVEFSPSGVRVVSPALTPSELATSLSSSTGLELASRIVAGDSNWQLEGSGVNRKLTLTLSKAASGKWLTLKKV